MVDLDCGHHVQDAKCGTKYLFHGSNMPIIWFKMPITSRPGDNAPRFKNADGAAHTLAPQQWTRENPNQWDFQDKLGVWEQYWAAAPRHSFVFDLVI
jgi:hypothetical protein